MDLRTGGLSGREAQPFEFAFDPFLILRSAAEIGTHAAGGFAGVSLWAAGNCRAFPGKNEIPSDHAPWKGDTLDLGPDDHRELCPP